MKKFFVCMMMLVTAASIVTAAPVIRPLTVQEMARYGATDALVIGNDDLTVAVENVAQTNTLTLIGPCAWAYQGYRLDAAFDCSTVTNLMSSLLTVTVDSTTLVNGLQIANDQTRSYPVFLPTSLSVTTTGPATNLLTSTGTWPYAGTIAAGSTSTVTVIVGAPGTGHTLNKVDTGQARVFLRILR